MQNLQNAKKLKQNQYLLYKLVLAFSITLALMMIWLNQFEDTEDQATKASFKLLTTEFRNAVNLTHVEWLRLAKPDSVQLYSDLNKPDDFTVIKMNQKGWPQVEAETQKACANLWQNLLNQRLTVIHSDISVKYERHSCRYELNKNQYLTYQSHTGEVNYQIKE